MKAIVIGIVGGTCSGKDIAVNNIRSVLGKRNITVLHQDSYYKTKPKDIPAEDYDFDSPSAIDWKRLASDIKELSSGNSIHVPYYDFEKHEQSKTMTKYKTATDVIIVEGILIFSNETLLDLFDYKLFIDADSDLRLARRIKRDMIERGRTLESVVNQYIKYVKPSHEKYIEPCKKIVDYVIPNNNNTQFTGVHKLGILVKGLIEK